MIGPMNTDSQGLVAAQLEAASAALIATIPAEVSDYVDGIIITDGDIITHAANFNAHGVTRELIAFTAATPPHIPGNLLSRDQQCGISGWSQYYGVLTTNVSGGADGGGEMQIAAAGGGAVASYSWTSLYAPVTAGVSYTASARLRLPVAGRSMNVRIWWQTSAGVDITSSDGVSVTSTAGGYVTAFVTGTAPVGATRAYLQVTASSTAPGEVFSVSTICLRTSPTIPSSSGVAGVLADGSAAVRFDGTDLVVSCSGGYGTAFMQIPGTGFARVNLEMLASAGSELWVYSPKSLGGYVYDWKNVSDNVWRSFEVAGDILGAGIYLPTSVNGSWFRLRDMRVERSIYS